MSSRASALVRGSGSSLCSVWLALLLGCASSSTAPETPLRADAQRALMSARTAGEQRQWSAAARASGSAALTFAAIGENEAEASARRDEAEALRRAGEPAAAEAADQRALALDRHAGRREDEARDLAGLARSAAAQGQLGRAIEAAEEARALATSGTSLAAVLENDIALYLLARGDASDHPRVRELLASALASSEARSDVRGIATNELNLGRLEFASGDPDLAEPLVQCALERFRALEDPDGLAPTQELLSRILFLRGEPEQARFHLAQSRAGFEFLRDRSSLERLDRLASEAR
jgi:tetratricopeptide (TPR) repeat protein